MGFTGAFPWHGGKSKLAPKIIPYFPKHDCYVEPFFGSGAMFFARKERAKVECVNDLNSEIANFFRVVREQADEFCEQLYFYPNSRNDLNYLRGLEVENLSPLNRALRFFIIQHNSFGGSSRGFVTKGTKGNPSNKLALFDKIKNISIFIKQTLIENCKFEKLLSLYDKNETFFYLDPPYYETDNGAYKQKQFPISGYEHIANFMKMQKGKTALSINDHPFIRELFKDFYIVEFPIKYSCKKGESTPRTELLVMNYEKEVDAC